MATQVFPYPNYQPKYFGDGVCFHPDGGSDMPRMGEYRFSEWSEACEYMEENITSDCWCIYVSDANDTNRQVKFNSIAESYEFRDKNGRHALGEEHSQFQSETIRDKISNNIFDFMLENLKDGWDGVSGTDSTREIHVVMGGSPFVRFVYTIDNDEIVVTVYSAVPGDALANYV